MCPIMNLYTMSKEVFISPVFKIVKAIGYFRSSRVSPIPQSFFEIRDLSIKPVLSISSFGKIFICRVTL